MKTFNYKDENFKEETSGLLERASYPETIENDVKKILQEVKSEGNIALVKFAKKNKVKSIIFREEATLASEFVIAVARNARRVNIKTIFVTKGFVSAQAIKKLSKFIDALIFEIDASLSEKFYKNFYGIDSNKIKSSIVQAKKNCFLLMKKMFLIGCLLTSTLEE